MTTTPKDHRAVIKQLVGALNSAKQSLETVGMLAGHKYYGNPRIETLMGSHEEVRAYAKSRAGATAEALTAGREALGADDSGFVINNTRNQVSSVQLHQLKEGLAVGRDGPVSPPSGLAQEDGTTPELDQMRGKPRPSQLAAQQLGGEAA